MRGHGAGKSGRPTAGSRVVRARSPRCAPREGEIIVTMAGYTRASGADALRADNHKGTSCSAQDSVVAGSATSARAAQDHGARQAAPDDERTPIARLRVEAFLDMGRREDHIGRATSGSDGRFSIAVDLPTAAMGHRVVVKVLERRSPVVPDEPESRRWRVVARARSAPLQAGEPVDFGRVTVAFWEYRPGPLPRRRTPDDLVEEALPEHGPPSGRRHAPGGARCCWLSRGSAGQSVSTRPSVRVERGRPRPPVVSLTSASVAAGWCLGRHPGVAGEALERRDLRAARRGWPLDGCGGGRGLDSRPPRCRRSAASVRLCGWLVWCHPSLVGVVVSGVSSVGACQSASTLARAPSAGRVPPQRGHGAHGGGAWLCPAGPWNDPDRPCAAAAAGRRRGSAPRSPSGGPPWTLGRARARCVGRVRDAGRWVHGSRHVSTMASRHTGERYKRSGPCSQRARTAVRSA